MKIRIRSDPLIFCPPDQDLDPVIFSSDPDPVIFSSAPDPVIFSSDPDPLIFSSDPDPDSDSYPTCNNGFIKLFSS